MKLNSLLLSGCLFLSSPLLVKAQALIKYDPGNKTQIPFDQPFFLQVDSIKSAKIKSVTLYEITYDDNHRRALFDPTQPRNIRPAFVIPQKDYTLYGTSLKILFPALRPDRDFDGLILTEFSKTHLKTVLEINKAIYANAIDNTKPPISQINQDLNVLLDEVNKPPVGATRGRTVWAYYNYPDFVTDIYNPCKSYYDDLKLDNGINALPNFTQPQIDLINKYIDQRITADYHFTAIQNVLYDNELARVADGLLPANYHLPVLPSKLDDQLDVDKRVANLTSSIAFTDSLDHAIGRLKNADETTYKAIRANLRAWAKVLNDNRQVLQKISQAITVHVNSQCQEAYWISQGTSSPDIKTTGTRHVTLDAGLMNIGVFDNNNHYNNMQKLFFGLSYYFASIDKNTDWKKIPVPADADSEATHRLESKYSRLEQRWTITAGFTLGAMKNKDFDNVYNGFSFTLGPGYRLNKYLRISAGAALVKRNTPNPLQTTSRFVVGNYVSLSLDYDLLSVASNITSALFK